jgi:DNA-binding SARP family transcriptional activator
VVWRGEPLEQAFRRRQSRLLFAFLVLNRRRAVRRDELVGAVWPDEGAPARAEELLSPLLSRLRKAIGPEALEGRHELTLRLPEGAVVDWEEVHEALDEARRQGVLVVQSSRAGSGRVIEPRRLREQGIVSAATSTRRRRAS